MLIYMLTGSVPMPGMKKAELVQRLAVERRAPDIPRIVPAGSPLKECFHVDPKARPSAKEIIEVRALQSTAEQSRSWEVSVWLPRTMDTPKPKPLHSPLFQPLSSS